VVVVVVVVGGWGQEGVWFGGEKVGGTAKEY